jgi:hypothetical protein
MRHVPCGHQQVQQDLPLLCPATLFDEERQVVAQRSRPLTYSWLLPTAVSQAATEFQAAPARTSRTVAVLPWPSTLLTSMSPPICTSKCLTITFPRPVPSIAWWR